MPRNWGLHPAQFFAESFSIELSAEPNRDSASKTTSSHKSPEQHKQRSSDKEILIISITEYRNKLLQRLSDNVEKVDEPIINLKDSARKLDD